MAHNIAKIAGKDAMFCVGKREDAWHLLGQRCENAASWKEAMQLAGLDWQVVKVQDYATNPAGLTVPVPTFTVFRDIDSAILGSVGAGFAVLQNDQCFQFVDNLLEANGGSHYDSAGALGNGAVIWCAVRVPSADIEIVGGDKLESYLVFTTGHDGSTATKVFLTTVRVVCQNTLQMSLKEANAMVSVKHTKNANARLDKAKDLMQGVKANAKNLEDKLKKLANFQMNRKSIVTVLDRLFPPSKEENANQTRRENVLSEILELYSKNDDNAIPEIRGTAYNLLNAVTEYTDHYRSARLTDGRAGMTLATARAENAVTGTGDRLKNNALEIIEQVVMADGSLVDRVRDDVAPSGDLMTDILAKHGY